MMCAEYARSRFAGRGVSPLPLSAIFPKAVGQVRQLRALFSVSVDQPIVLPYVEARENVGALILSAASMAPAVCRPFEAGYAADVVPVINNLHPV